MATNPTNQDFGRRPYVNQTGDRKDNYVDEITRKTDKATFDAAGRYARFIRQSEMKKPYMNPDYQNMEYGTEPYDPPPPGPGPTPGPGPGPGPTPDPGPDPHPDDPPTPDPDPYDWSCWGCSGITIDQERYCQNGGPIVVKFHSCGADPIIKVAVISGSGSVGGIHGGGGGQGWTNTTVIFTPGDSTSVRIEGTTGRGAHCITDVYSKPKGECCGSPTIGYTTLQMSLGETQRFTVIGGLSVPYTWLNSGGGSITEGGLYTAPASNPSCSQNPVINLVCDGQTVATLAIAINAFTDPIRAYYIATMSGSGCTWAIYKQAYRCDGTTYGSSAGCTSCDCQTVGSCEDCACEFTTCYPPAGCGCWGNWNVKSSGFFCRAADLRSRCTSLGSCGSLNGLPIACSGASDVRTAAQILAGCCPAALL